MKRVEVEQAVGRFLRHVAVERGLADNTLAAYRRDLARYQAHLAEAGRTDIGDVTTADVAGFLDRIRGEDGAAASSAARMLSSVRGLHRFLSEDGAVADDVAHEVEPPKLPLRLPKAIP